MCTYLTPSCCTCRMNAEMEKGCGERARRRVCERDVVTNRGKSLISPYVENKLYPKEVEIEDEWEKEQ